MNRVRLLSEQVANQIAAGEVVERPASVVKELVENALDAGSSMIRVDIQAGGRSLIRVTDDGFGMSRDDALLCLERHATSKIQRAEDLSCIATMGFRGEALPSIASVSRFTLTTREKDSASPEATQVVVNGGKIMEVKASGAAPGTTVEVRQLFFNLPARRKFLRTEETESAHIQHYLTLAALSHPKIGFSFYRDARLIWQLPAVTVAGKGENKIEALGQRLRALYGSEQKLLPVDYISTITGASNNDDEPPPQTEFRLWGLIGAPGASRSTRDDQHLFVNRRPVDNRGLNYALIEGYHNSLMKGRYPVCCLFLEIDPALVDVNIHPSKREVKFHREGDVRRLAAEAVRQTLMAFHSGAPAMSTTKPTPQPANTSAATAPRTVSATSSPIVAPSPAPSRDVETLAPGEASAAASQAENSESAASVSAAGEARPPLTLRAEVEIRPHVQHTLGLDANSAEAPGSNPASSVGKVGGLQSPENASAQPQGVRQPVPLLDVPMRLIGVVGRLYVLLESDRGLVLLDQHAAHERILFEQMLARLESEGRAASQKLLLPQTVELSARDAVFLRDHLESLSRMGVGLSEFGDRTFLLDALPPFVKVRDPRHFVLELVDQLKAAGQGVNVLRLGEHVVAKTVCRHAVKANDPLNGAELENLVQDLRRCSMPYTCPHGRPTLIEMNYRELEKKFGRAQ